MKLKNKIANFINNIKYIWKGYYRPPVEWYNINFTAKGKIVDPELSRASRIKHIDVPICLRYDPSSGRLQQAPFVSVVSQKYNKNRISWIDIDISKFNGMTLSINLKDRIEEVKKEYYDKHKFDMRDNNLSDLLNGIE